MTTEEVVQTVASLEVEVAALKGRIVDIETKKTRMNRMPLLMPNATPQEIVDRLNNIIVYLNRGIEYGSLG